MRYKNILIKIVLSIIFAVLIQCILVYVNKQPNEKFNGKVTNISDLLESTNNLETKNKNYLVTGDDPYLVYNTNEIKSGCIMLSFEKSFKEDVKLQIFYNLNNGFNEDESIIVPLKAGSRRININIPENKYKKIRVDFDTNENVEIAINDIQISSINEKEFILFFGVKNFIQIIIFIIGFYYLFILVEKYRDKCKSIILVLLKSRSPKIDILFITLLSIIFFAVMPIITFDSLWYHTYLEIFDGIKPITQWDPSRGVPFPLIIYISTKLFGYTTQGITITMYIFYMITILLLYKTLEIIEFTKKMGKFCCWIFLIFFIYINPIFLGYYHMVLTEFVACTLVVLSTYISIKTYLCFINGNKNLRNYFLRYGLPILIGVIAFFVKQMFIAPILLCFIATEILLWLKNKTIKSVVFSFGCVLLCLSCVIIINARWYKTIDIQNATDIFGRKFTNSDSLKSGMIGGLRYFVPEDSSKQIIKVNIMNNNQTIDSFETVNPEESLKNTFIYMINCLIRSPQTVFKGYLDNYFVISNLYYFKDSTANIARQEIKKDFSLTYGRENYYLACIPNMLLERGSMVYDGSLDDVIKFSGSEQYKQKYDINIIIKLIFNSVYIKIANFIYSFICLIAFPVMIISFLQIKKDKRNSIIYKINFILAFSIFFNIFALAAVSSNIDRYMFPLYPACVIVFANLIYLIFRTLKSKCKINHQINKLQ